MIVPRGIIVADRRRRERIEPIRRHRRCHDAVVGAVGRRHSDGGGRRDGCRRRRRRRRRGRARYSVERVECGRRGILVLLMPLLLLLRLRRDEAAAGMILRHHRHARLLGGLHESEPGWRLLLL